MAAVRNPLEEMGRWLKEQGIIRRERTSAEWVALALFLYTQGLSTRQVARVLQPLGVRVSHVAVWNWVHKYSRRVNPKALWLPPLPPTLIVDDTALQLGSRRIWLFLATDPERRAIVYAEPYAGRSRWDVEEFLQTIRRLYGRWPRRWVTDRGPWYRTVSVVLTAMEHVQMTRGIRNRVESLFTQLRRRLAGFAGYFPEGSVERVKEWIGTWAGFYNLSKLSLC
jgi:transposase-like protein